MIRPGEARDNAAGTDANDLSSCIVNTCASSPRPVQPSRPHATAVRMPGMDEDQMDEEDPPEISTWLYDVAFWARMGLARSVLYVLSIGPAAHLDVNGLLGGDEITDGFSWFYEPLSRLHDYGPDLIRQVLELYVDLWQ